MVTGGAPFQGSRVGDTLANAREGRYVEPEGLSASAKDFLACMLSLVSFACYFALLLVCLVLSGRATVSNAVGV